MKKAWLLSLGLIMNFGLINSVSATEVAPYSSKGSVDFVPNMGVTDPVNPMNPDPDNPVKPIDPSSTTNKGSNGPLSIDYASSFNFGVNKISNKNEVYYARAQTYFTDSGAVSNLVTPNYVQVSDNRGNNGGWTLTVRQSGQFKNEETLNKELTGAQVTLSSPTVSSNAQNVTAPIPTPSIALDVMGAESVVMSAATDAGAGTWVDYWGTVETITEKDQNNKDVKADVVKAVALSIPGSTPKDAVSYETTLVWSLSDVPRK